MKVKNKVKKINKIDCNYSSVNGDTESSKYEDNHSNKLDSSKYNIIDDKSSSRYNIDNKLNIKNLDNKAISNTKSHKSENDNEYSNTQNNIKETYSTNNLPIGLVTVMGHSERIPTVYGNDLRNKNPCKMGNNISLLFIRGQPLIIIGPQYIYALSLFVLVLTINLLLNYIIYPRTSIIIVYCGIIIYFFFIVLFFYNFLINPGIPNRKYYISDNVIRSIYTYLEYTNSDSFDKYKICKICNIYVPPEKTVIHCEDCNICIAGKQYT